MLAVLAAGFGAGVLSSTVGVASLLSFPVLLALGLSPVVANVSNTLGLVVAGMGGALGFRSELRKHAALAWRVIALTGAAGAVGSLVLLGLPASVFEAVVPWLILGSCLLVGVQPRISAWLATRRGEEDAGPRLTLSPMTTVFVVLTGVYGGYFGAGAGVMMVAVLAIGTDLALQSAAALRTLSLMASNLVAGLIFAVVAEVDWSVVGLLSLGSVVGGYAGARLARRMPTAVLRTAVVLAGVVGFVVLIR